MRGELVALDLETTGLDPTNDAIIEFGAVRIKNGEILAEFSGSSEMIAVLSGPSHAEEVSRGLATTVVAAASSAANPREGVSSVLSVPMVAITL